MLFRLLAPLIVTACGRWGFDPLAADDATAGDAVTLDAVTGDAATIDVCGDTSGLQAGAPGPVIHGCPTNSGRSRVVGPASGATSFTPRGTTTQMRGVAIAAGNKILVEEQYTGDVYAYDAAGAPLWTFGAAVGAGLEPTVVIDEAGVAYHLTNYGMIFAVDTATGGERWRLQQAGSFSAPVISAPGTLYFGAGAPYGFYAIDTVAQAPKWHIDVPNGGDAITAPAIGNGLVYFVDTLNSWLYGLDPEAMGAIRLAVAIPGTAHGSPVLGGDIVYVATMTSGIAAFDAVTGAALWQRPPGEAVVQPALLASGDLVSSTQDGRAFVLERVSGDERATWSIGASPLGPPRIDLEDSVYFATAQGSYAFTATGGARWQSPLTGVIAIAENGLVVLPAAQIVAMIGP